MSAPRPPSHASLVALLVAAAALLSFAWIFAGVVTPQKDGAARLETLHALATQSASREAVPGGAAGGAALYAPPFACAHLIAAVTSWWPPDGLNPLYGLVISFTGLAALALAFGALVRDLLEAEVAFEHAAVAPVLWLAASPVLFAALKDPAAPYLVVFVLTALLVAGRREAPRLAVALACAATLVNPCSVGWLAYALYHLAGRGERGAVRARTVLGALGAALLVSAPQLLALHREPGLAAFPGVAESFVAQLRELTDKLQQRPLVPVGVAGLLLSHRRALLMPVVVATALWLLFPGGMRAGHLMVGLGAPLMIGFAEFSQRAARNGFALTVGCFTAVLAAARMAPLVALHALPPADGSVSVPLAASALGCSPPLLGMIAFALAIAAVVLGALRAHLSLVWTYLGAASLGTLGLLLGAGAPRTPPSLAWSGRAAVVDGTHATHAWHPQLARPVTRLEVVTHIESAASLEGETFVGQVVLRDSGGHERTYPLFANFDTALESQRSSPRRGFSPLDLAAASYQPCPAPDGTWTIGRSFRKTCELPEPAEVEEIRIELGTKDISLAVPRIRLYAR